MSYEPTASELAAHTFAYDAASLDKELADYIQRFYTLSDDKVHADSWVACFSDDARLKRKMDDVVGRQSALLQIQNRFRIMLGRRVSVTDTASTADISNVNLENWKGQAERLHIVYKVFPFGAGKTDEVMLYGKSEYDYEDGSTGEMLWSARLHFKRSDSGIAIDLYHIYAVRRFPACCAPTCFWSNRTPGSGPEAQKLLMSRETVWRRK